MFFFFDNEDIENGENIFENIKHINEFDEEYWFARELQKVLEYTEWRNFTKVIEKAKVACENSNNVLADHFVDVNNKIEIGKGGRGRFYADN